MIFVNAEFFRNAGGNGLCIAGEHDGFGDAGSAQVANRLCRIGLDFVRNYDVAQIFVSGTDMHDGSDFHIRMVIFRRDRDSQILHQLEISGADAAAVHFRDDALSADFLRVTDTDSK